MITWIIYIIVAAILFFVLYLAILGIDRGVKAKNANKSTTNISNKMEQNIKKMLYISNSTNNSLCNHNIKSKTIIKNRNEFNNKVIRPIKKKIICTFIKLIYTFIIRIWTG